MVSIDSKPQYGGLTIPENDAEWDARTHGCYFALTTPEASILYQDTNAASTICFAPYDSIAPRTVFAVPDVLHFLHCLNAVRKHLDSGYHGTHIELPVEYRGMYNDHYLYQLRQSIMCHEDLTPMTLKPVWE